MIKDPEILVHDLPGSVPSRPRPHARRAGRHGDHALQPTHPQPPPRPPPPGQPQAGKVEK